ncbi:hypothetical protein GVN16_19625 [Emticicia sp. CRIBPO]|uniref:hypothetical protein n=1 Tax=Emticicia sp. CRIBPO TaxID=2683258 RepID=UPI001412350B|nr:hypothetical protein [Emticicia sp. CRIBPO]NBA87990.1 hypothetical protein [Emticicia sp. CRIBPO]
MTYKWNLQEAENYAKAFAALLSDEYFKNKLTINGGEILNLTESKQLNLLTIRELYDKWQTETERLKSPYFDFEQSEVKQALADFMNVLSRFILVNKDNFIPLLTKSTKKTLELYISPVSFFENLMRDLPDFKLTSEWLKNNGRFFKDYGWVLSEMLNRLSGLQFVYANQAIDWVKEIITDDKIENHEKALRDFSQILPLPFGFGSTPTAAPAKKGSSFFDTDFSNDIPKMQEQAAALPEPVFREFPKIEPAEPVRKSADVVEVVAEKSVTETFAPTQPPVEQRLNEKLTNESKTINESLTEGQNHGASLSDFHQKRKIESISGSISLNQRFLFINNLFEGKYEVFNQAVNELEACSSFTEAKEQMLRNYMPKFKWDLRSAEAEEFFDILKRRFN